VNSNVPGDVVKMNIASLVYLRHALLGKAGFFLSGMEVPAISYYIEKDLTSTGCTNSRFSTILRGYLQR
jgi:hypothetical protein